MGLQLPPIFLMNHVIAHMEVLVILDVILVPICSSSFVLMWTTYTLKIQSPNTMNKLAS